MTQQEFTERTKVQVSWDEYWQINESYNRSSMSKDEFCEWWCNRNKARVAQAVAERKEQERRLKTHEKAFEILCKLDRKVNQTNNWHPATEFIGKTMKQWLNKHGIFFGEETMIMSVQYQLRKMLKAV